jgi:hypothetical protein
MESPRLVLTCAALLCACAAPRFDPQAAPRPPAPPAAQPSTTLEPRPPAGPTELEVAVSPTSFRLFEDFSGLDLRRDYALSTSPGVTVCQADGLLRMAAVSPVTFAGGSLIVNVPFTPTPSAPLVASARIRLGAQEGHLGSTARIQLVGGGGSVYVNLGMLSSQGIYSQQQPRGSGSFLQTVFPGTAFDDRWHLYRIDYDGSAARLRADGVLVATVPIELRQVQVWLQIHTHYAQPGTAFGEYDDFAVGEGL